MSQLQEYVFKSSLSPILGSKIALLAVYLLRTFWYFPPLTLGADNSGSYDPILEKTVTLGQANWPNSKNVKIFWCYLPKIGVIRVFILRGQIPTNFSNIPYDQF